MIEYFLQIVQSDEVIAERMITGEVLPRAGETFTFRPYKGSSKKEIRESFQKYREGLIERGYDYVNIENVEVAIDSINFHNRHRGSYRVLSVEHPASVHFYIRSGNCSYFIPDFEKNIHKDLIQHTKTRALLPIVKLEKIAGEKGK